MELKNQLYDLIQEEKLNKKTLNNFIGDISYILGNPKFMEGLIKLINIICEERDGVPGFSTGDLKVLQQELKSGNFIIITQIINGVMLLFNSTDNNVSFNKKKAEEVVLKVLVYALFIEVPKRTGGLKKLNKTDKILLLDVIIALYDGYRNKQSLESAYDDIMQLVTSDTIFRIFPCCGNPDNTELVNKEMSKIQENLNSAIKNTREIVNLRNKVHELEEQIIKTASETTTTDSDEMNKSDSIIIEEDE